MAEKEEFFSFEEALEELRLQEEELKRLVSEGEIRAFREGETMKLRRADVESLRSELSGDVVDLGGGGDELVFEDDQALDEAGMATEQISEADTILEDDVEDVGEVDVELDAEDGDEIETVVPIAAKSRRSAAVEAPESEGVLSRFMMFATTALMIIAIPVCMAMASDQVPDFAKSVIGLFTDKLK